MALVLAGCTPPEPTEPTPPPTPENSTDAPLDEQAMETNAFALAREFVALVDEGFVDAALPLERLRDVATATAIQKVQGELDQFVRLGWRIQGSSAIDSPSLTGWGGPGQERGTAQLLACLDTSGVITTDENGEPTSGDEPRQPRLFTIEYDRDEMLISDVSPVADSTELEGCGS